MGWIGLPRTDVDLLVSIFFLSLTFAVGGIGIAGGVGGRDGGRTSRLGSGPGALSGAGVGGGCRVGGPVETSFSFRWAGWSLALK